MSDQISDGTIAKIIKVVIFNISAKFHAFFKIWTFIQGSRWTKSVCKLLILTIPTSLLDDYNPIFLISYYRYFQYILKIQNLATETVTTAHTHRAFSLAGFICDHPIKFCLYFHLSLIIQSNSSTALDPWTRELMNGSVPIIKYARNVQAGELYLWNL